MTDPECWEYIADSGVLWVDDDGILRQQFFRNGEEIAYPWQLVEDRSQ